MSLSKMVYKISNVLEPYGIGIVFNIPFRAKKEIINNSEVLCHINFPSKVIIHLLFHPLSCRK